MKFAVSTGGGTIAALSDEARPKFLRALQKGARVAED